MDIQKTTYYPPIFQLSPEQYKQIFLDVLALLSRNISTNAKEKIYSGKINSGPDSKVKVSIQSTKSDVGKCLLAIVKMIIKNDFSSLGNWMCEQHLHNQLVKPLTIAKELSEWEDDAEIQLFSSQIKGPKDRKEPKDPKASEDSKEVKSIEEPNIWTLELITEFIKTRNFTIKDLGPETQKIQKHLLRKHQVEQQLEETKFIVSQSKNICDTQLEGFKLSLDIDSKLVFHQGPPLSRQEVILLLTDQWKQVQVQFQQYLVSSKKYNELMKEHFQLVDEAKKLGLSK